MQEKTITIGGVTISEKKLVDYALKHVPPLPEPKWLKECSAAFAEAEGFDEYKIHRDETSHTWEVTFSRKGSTDQVILVRDDKSIVFPGKQLEDIPAEEIFPLAAKAVGLSFEDLCGFGREDANTVVIYHGPAPGIRVRLVYINGEFTPLM